MTFRNSSVQTLDKYADDLYFGMLSCKPDTKINDFVAKYVPVVLKKPGSDGKWTAYPPDSFTEPKFETVTNSFVFYEHPYFDARYKSGQLAVTQKIYPDPDWSDNITAMKLWFEFDNENDAQNSYEKLVETFSTFNTLKRLTSENGIDKAEFTDKNSDKVYSSIQILFAKDLFIRTEYAIPTSDGFRTITKTGYKILVEVGNDLY
jgi:hypothetical protein